MVPGVAHHVTQRGNRRQPVFFEDEDYSAYIELVSVACRQRDVHCLAWCLMPNHVHLILVLADADGLQGTRPFKIRRGGWLQSRCTATKIRSSCRTVLESYRESVVSVSVS